MIFMSDNELMDELYRRFHSASANAFSDRIAHLRIEDLPFKDIEGTPFGEVKHLIRGDDKSGAAFDIFRLGWFGGRVWELVIVDGAYLPHMHRKINSEFLIVAGRGHLSRDAEWIAYREKSGVAVGKTVAHGFITDPEFGPTVFLSIQSDPIRKIWIDPNTQTEKFEDDFVYVDDAFPLPADLLELRRQKLAARSRQTAEQA
jgi:mannose-6-phosphate isomerase-like protein (cupin superfamily)